MEFANPLSTIPNRTMSLVANLHTLIKLRWLAIVGVVCALGLAYWFGLNLPFKTHLLLTSALLALNIAYLVALKSVSGKEQNSDEYVDDGKLPRPLLAILFAQIACDWLLLTAFLHFSGGMMNPFLIIFVLHMIIGVSLLEFNLTFILASFGMILIASTTALEYYGLLAYHPLIPSLPAISELPLFYVIGMLAALAIVLTISGGITYTLVQGIRERERKLYKMSQDLVALSKLRSEFLFRVTHELKSPVAAMMSAVDAVSILGGDCLDEKALDMLTRIRRRGEGLLNLIKDLLEIARLSTPSFEVEMKDLNTADILRMICETEEFKAQEKGIELKVDISAQPVVHGDESALREVFSNLVSNAVRYTPEKGRVTVSLSLESGKMKLVVTDTGIGISEEDQKKLFSEFFRAANAKKFTPAGTGLGLAITKQHIERMGGTISVSSKLNEGTTFAIVLPAVNAGR